MNLEETTLSADAPPAPEAAAEAPRKRHPRRRKTKERKALRNRKQERSAEIRGSLATQTPVNPIHKPAPRRFPLQSRRTIQALW